MKKPGYFVPIDDLLNFKYVIKHFLNKYNRRKELISKRIKRDL